MKKVKLKAEEWLRLYAVTDDEKQKAINATIRYVSGQMIERGLNRDSGPLSDKEMGGNASVEIAKIAYTKLFGGKVHWKPTCTLTTQMINIAYSEMGHIIRDYYAKGKDGESIMSHLTFNQQMEMELANQVSAESKLRNLGYDIAQKAVKGNLKLLSYLDALYEEDDYRAIAKRLNVTKSVVMELEKELLAILENS